MNHPKICVLALIGSLVSCGGSSSPDEPVVIIDLDTKTGVFLDSPVINLSYKTETLSGVTNSLGEFSYVEGQAVTFSIGDLTFPAVPGLVKLTPLNLAGTLDTNNTEVVNIVRLLQTLDQDADPSNGITITDTAKAVATQTDFSLSEADFSSSAAVTNLIFNAGQDQVVSGLVQAESALVHFEQELSSNGINFGTIAEGDDRVITEYLANNNLTAEAHESGLYYHIIEEGTGEHPPATSRVTVKYKGFLIDGTVFDQTSGDDSVEFTLSDLITGWKIGIPLLKAGGKANLYIPSALGYGAGGSGNTIPPNSVLIFDIELVSFQ